MASYIFYIDETGSRHPDKNSDASRKGRDWFGLGGILVKQEDVITVKERHRDFCEMWNITRPLHMTDILAKKKGFAWIGKLSEERCKEFWSDYKEFLGTLPVVGHACIIDRPGYVNRGYLKNPGDKWLLCRSAFDIVIERAAKIAQRDDRKLEIVFEGDIGINETIKGYFKNLKENGLAFDGGRSGKYKPLSKEEFAVILATIEYKGKSNSLLQIADSYIYAIARNKYDKKFDLFRHLGDRKRIVNFTLTNEEIPSMGIKYYCFDV